MDNEVHSKSGRRSKFLSVALATLAAVGLTFGSITPAYAADFTKVTLGKVSTITLPKSGKKTTKFTVKFSGPTAGFTYDMSTTAENVWKPKGVQLNTIAGVEHYKKVRPGTNKASVRAWKTSTPGVYRVTVQIRQFQNSALKKVITAKSKLFNVKANPSYSKKKSVTEIFASGKARSAVSATVWAPGYQVGAKATLYYKPKGNKSWIKIGTKKLKVYSSSRTKSYASFKIAKKYDAARKGGKLYVKVGSVRLAKGYKSAQFKPRLNVW